MLRFALRAASFCLSSTLSDNTFTWICKSADFADLFVCHDVFLAASFITLLQVTELLDSAGNDTSALSIATSVKSGFGGFTGIVATESLLSFGAWLLQHGVAAENRKSSTDEERSSLLGSGVTRGGL